MLNELRNGNGSDCNAGDLSVQKSNDLPAIRVAVLVDRDGLWTLQYLPSTADYIALSLVCWWWNGSSIETGRKATRAIIGYTG